ncbi:MAG: HAD family hydrolase [Anaerolineae bacterium]|nr:MAG: HAD family hydrolase [Anaerolineae bacterium]
MKLILFDIDGTLLLSKGAGAAATRLAMQEVFGTVGTLDRFQFGGKTDWQMLLETLEGLIVPEVIQTQLKRYDGVLAHHLEAIIDNFETRPCAGAQTLLQRCLDNSQMAVGLITANMPTSAGIKLRAAGYEPTAFHFGVFGSEAVHRSDLAPIALRRAKQTFGYPPEQVWMIGDTPEDIACAKACGANVLAVATGRYSADALAGYHPTHVVENLADTDLIWSLLTR